MDKMNDLCALLTMDDIEEKSAKTKRALLPSIIAVIVCIAMLAGTTLAWFTDTTSSGLNQIRSGNLDVAVEYTLDGENWNDLEGATDLFGGEGALFEPGYTRVVAFRITNNGGVALKYKVGMNVASETKGTNKAGEKFSLSDYLKVKTAVPADAEALATAFTSREDGESLDWTEYDFNELVIDATGTINAGTQDVNYYVMKVYMPETVDNVANANSKENTASISFGVDVVATQAPVESDSYDNQYDANAACKVETAAAMKKALEKGGIVEMSADIDPTEALVASKTATIDANGKTIANTKDVWEANPESWSLVSARGTDTELTITGDGDFQAKENDCYAVDVQDGATVTIKDGTFNGNIHAVYVHTGTAIIEGGFYSVQQKFPEASKANEFVLNCRDANYKNGTAKIIVTGGTFVNFNPADCCAEGAYTSFVAEGYTVVSETQADGDTWYTVVPVE